MDWCNMDVEIPAQDVTVTSGYQVVTAAIMEPAHEQNAWGGTFTVTAPEGTLVVGGGYTMDDFSGFFVYENAPASDGTSWSVAAGAIQNHNYGTSTQVGTVYAIVLDLP
jgi:hypothetical protein